MKIITISTFDKLLFLLQHEYSSSDFIFRGVNNEKYELIPKIGRSVYIRKNKKI